MKRFELYEKYNSSRNSVTEIENYLKVLMEYFELDESVYRNIHLSIYEAFINAVFHGNHIDSKKYVGIYTVYNNNTITIQITDEGNGFDTESLPDPIDAENLLKDCGRGVFLINNLVDCIKFENTPRGFRTTIQFKLIRDFD